MTVHADGSTLGSSFKIRFRYDSKILHLYDNMLSVYLLFISLTAATPYFPSSIYVI